MLVEVNMSALHGAFEEGYDKEHFKETIGGLNWGKFAERIQ
jgi:hypothetical protein